MPDVQEPSAAVGGPSLRTCVTVSSPGTGKAAGRPVGFDVAFALHAVRALSLSPPLRSFSLELLPLLPQPAAARPSVATVSPRGKGRLIIRTSSRLARTVASQPW